MQTIELALCIRHICRGDLHGFRFLLQQFQLAPQFLKLLLQCMDLRDIGTLVQIGGGRLPSKAQPFQFSLQQPDGITQFQRLTLGLVHAGREFVLH
nr:hypothetical protein [Bacteroides cellulosilyticus]